MLFGQACNEGQSFWNVYFLNPDATGTVFDAILQTPTRVLGTNKHKNSGQLSSQTAWEELEEIRNSTPQCKQNPFLRSLHAAFPVGTSMAQQLETCKTLCPSLPRTQITTKDWPVCSPDLVSATHEERLGIPARWSWANNDVCSMGCCWHYTPTRVPWALHRFVASLTPH